jgi:hypothetical protein
MMQSAKQQRAVVSDKNPHGHPRDIEPPKAAIFCYPHTPIKGRTAQIQEIQPPGVVAQDRFFRPLAPVSDVDRIRVGGNQLGSTARRAKNMAKGSDRRATSFHAFLAPSA